MAHHEHEVRAPKAFEVPAKFRTACIAMAIIGLVGFGVGLFVDKYAAWNGYLIGFWFTLSLGLAGAFLNATQFLAIASWSVPVRRIAEAMGQYVPVATILFFGLIFGGSTLYHWWDPAYVAADSILLKKAAVLDSTVFAAVGLVALGVLSLLIHRIRSISLRMDQTGDSSDYPTQKSMSAIFLVCFVIGFTCLSWYCLMSLEPHWFSTMWSVYMFAGMFQSGLALIIVIILYLKDQDYFGDFLSTKHVHDLGQFLFAYTVFYAYIAFSQFLLIWYANIPEEAMFYVTRGTPPDVSTGWEFFSLFIPIFKFVVPFFILLPQDHKKNKNNILRFTAIWLIFMQLMEVWWIVAPTPHEKGALAAQVSLPIFELLTTVGFVGIFAYVVATSLAKANLVPTKDPFLAESIEHHNHGVRPPRPDHIVIS